MRSVPVVPGKGGGQDVPGPLAEDIFFLRLHVLLVSQSPLPPLPPRSPPPSRPSPTPPPSPPPRPPGPRRQKIFRHRPDVQGGGTPPLSATLSHTQPPTPTGVSFCF